MTSIRRPSTFLFYPLFLWVFAGLLPAADEAVSEENPPAPKEEETSPGEDQKSAPENADESGVETKDTNDDDLKKAEAEEIAVARPVSADPVQVYGWREYIFVSDGEFQEKMPAKLDTGARTSSIHAEEKELFERDGKKWVRFVVTDPGEDDSKRLRIEAPLVRIARIKEPGGESKAREVVRLSFKIGDRTLKADFTLNNRVNMLSPVLIGRRTIKVLGWVDPSRAYLADKKLMR